MVVVVLLLLLSGLLELANTRRMIVLSPSHRTVGVAAVADADAAAAAGSGRRR